MYSSDHIDDIFRDQFNQLEITPPSQVWANIEAELDKKEERKIIFVWKNYMWAASILLVISMSIGLGWLLNDQKPTNEIAIAKIETNKAQTIRNSQTHDKSSTDNYIKTSRQRTNSNSSNNTQSANKATIASFTSTNDNRITQTNNNHPTNYESATESPLITENNSNRTYLKPMQSISSFAANNISTNQLKTKNQSPKYLPLTMFDELAKTEPTSSSHQIAISGLASPSYSNQSSDNSSTKSGINENGITSVTGGLKIAFNTSKSRWSIETGVIYAKAGQNVSTKVFNTYSLKASAEYELAAIDSDILTSNSLGSINTNTEQISSVYMAMDNSDNIKVQSASEISGSKININQALQYIEIPFMARYNLLQKQQTLSLAMGLSANFLIGNSANLTSNGVKTYLGKTEAIDKISYSARIGLGVTVPLYKQLFFNVEPTVNYFLQPVNNQGTSNFKPYTIAIFTGFTYKL